MTRAHAQGKPNFPKGVNLKQSIEKNMFKNNPIQSSEKIIRLAPKLGAISEHSNKEREAHQTISNQRPPPQARESKQLAMSNNSQFYQQAQAKMGVSPREPASPVKVVSSLNEARTQHRLQSGQDTRPNFRRKSTIDDISKNLQRLQRASPQRSEKLRKPSETQRVQRYHVNGLENPTQPKTTVKVTRDPFRKVINEYQDQFIENSDSVKRSPTGTRSSKLVQSIDLMGQSKSRPIVITSRKSYERKIHRQSQPRISRQSIQLKQYNRYEEVVNQIDLNNQVSRVSGTQVDLKRSKHSRSSLHLSSPQQRAVHSRSNTISESKELQMKVVNKHQIRHIRYVQPKSQSPNPRLSRRVISTYSEPVTQQPSSTHRVQMGVRVEKRPAGSDSPYNVSPKKLGPAPEVYLSSTNQEKDPSQSPTMGIDQISRNLVYSQKKIPNRSNDSGQIRAPSPHHPQIQNRIVRSPHGFSMSQRVVTYSPRRSQEKSPRKRIISQSGTLGNTRHTYQVTKSPSKKLFSEKNVQNSKIVVKNQTRPFQKPTNNIVYIKK